MTYAGSADFNNPQRLGQVDMIRAIRSPGSTLKPFIYGMGFDDNIIHPKTRIADSASRFDRYIPSNFDGIFHGNVSISQALQQSLNIPAVAILAAVDPQRFVNHLRDHGALLQLPNTEKAALPIALGGIGTTLENLVTLYSTLAQNDTLKTLLYTQEQQQINKQTLLSTHAIDYLRAILKDVPRPIGYLSSEFGAANNSIAFKTGTSYGYRDAWAIGFSNHYTVGVWIGRPDGTPHYHYTGIKAAQLLFRTFDMINNEIQETPLQTVAIDEPAQGLRFYPHKLAQLTPLQQPLKIFFPLNDTVLTFNKTAPIMLQAKHGKKPYHWLINGLAIHNSVDFSKQYAWQIKTPGAYHISVIDANGQHDSVDVWATPMLG